MTLQEAYRLVSNVLSTIYDNREAANITNLVTEKITGHNRLNRLVHSQAVLTLQQEQQLRDCVALLIKHTPVQYVLEEAWFYGLPFYVNQHVLIPRPETEELVDWIIKDEKKNADITSPRIMDIGTGSGCIPVTLKKNLPDAEVHTLDVSPKAIEVARKNAQQLDTAIQFHEADILNLSEKIRLPFFDIIVSNPPYIPMKDKEEMHANVLEHEPHLALFVSDENPLQFYHAIASFAQHQLTGTGRVYLELHEIHGQQVAGLFAAAGFKNILLKKDMQGKNRMLKAGI